jgi:ribosomal protein S18 acetylase RimI-like enzyme
MDRVTIRPAKTSDRPALRLAPVELQEFERRLHETRLPGEVIADAYLDWMLWQAAESGAVLVAESGGMVIGFVAGWIERTENIAETADSNRVGYISDICVLPSRRGHGIAGRLLDNICKQLETAGMTRIGIASLADNRSARASYERTGFCRLRGDLREGDPGVTEFLNFAIAY